MNFANEVQVIWSENLNTVVNEKANPTIPAATPQVVKNVVEEVVVVITTTTTSPAVENVAEILQEVN